MSTAEPHADPEEVARTVCLRQLAMAPRSRGQLRESMARHNVPAAVGERVLDRLAEVGLVDDAAFAAAWVRARHTGRGLARHALHHELSERGVDAGTAAEAIEGLAADEERATARRLAERKLRTTQTLDVQSRVRRVAGMLTRKGYPAGMVLAVVREVLAEEAAASPLPDIDGVAEVKSCDDPVDILEGTRLDTSGSPRGPGSLTLP